MNAVSAYARPATASIEGITHIERCLRFYEGDFQSTTIETARFGAFYANVHVSQSRSMSEVYPEISSTGVM